MGTYRKKPVEAGPVGPTYMGQPFTPAMQDVLAERVRQVAGEGFTAEHDDAYVLGELALAGAAYAGYAAAKTDGSLTIGSTAFGLWPWRSAWWKPGPARRMLVKAAALIIAEIERLDRKAAKEGTAS